VPDEHPGTSRDDGASKPRTFTFRRTFTFGKPPATGPDGVTVSGPEKTIEWSISRPDEPSAEPNGDEPGLGRPPKTYYEAFTGRPDPHLKFFVSGRKWLKRAVNVTALAFPIIGLAIGFLSGSDLLTTLLIGFGGAIIGLMLKTSFPKTPFD
jgi:hypothetical protein